MLMTCFFSYKITDSVCVHYRITYVIEKCSIPKWLHCWFWRVSNNKMYVFAYYLLLLSDMFTEEDAIQHSCCHCCRCCCYCLKLVCIALHFRPFIIWRHTAETCQCVYMSTMNHSLSHRISMISTTPSIYPASLSLSLPLPSAMSFNICFTSHTFCRHQIYESVRILWDDWFRFSFFIFPSSLATHLAVLSIHYIPHHIVIIIQPLDTLAIHIVQVKTLTREKLTGNGNNKQTNKHLKTM